MLLSTIPFADVFIKEEKRQRACKLVEVRCLLSRAQILAGAGGMGDAEYSAASQTLAALELWSKEMERNGSGMQGT